MSEDIGQSAATDAGRGSDERQTTVDECIAYWRDELKQAEAQDWHKTVEICRATISFLTCIASNPVYALSAMASDPVQLPDSQQAK